MEKIRVLIVDNEALVRHALRIFVDRAEATAVVGEATNGADAIEECVRLQPDVVLMDIQMPQLNGIEATAQLSERCPDSRVLAITTFSSDSHVVAALRAGASGFLVKDTAPDEIIKAIVDVHEGRSVLSPQITRDLISVILDSGEQHGESSAERLTDREQEIVTLLSQGMSNSEIAQELSLSEATIKANMSRIMNKWSVRDRVQVLIHAVRSGLVTL
ncbi:response regulator transcription factor [Pseudactinotalea sp. HY158]|uniref:response regulator n=1 Tax=unclassified Pseudactinotalea TaxID=2649176 RepID=UPI00129C986E|nr:response regulator transcription factor [Pseudactinotalea sp. HY158]MPV49826.1 response regulator [Pseudactinotalea sp. HY160]QGH69092.1 response regulator [Pseudactinotalea sp. HY158]